MALTAPANFLATAINEKDILTEWTYTGSTPTAFEIHGKLKSEPESAFRFMGTETADDRNKTIRGLMPATAYDFRCRAISGSMKGLWSRIDGSTTKGTAPTPTPTGFPPSSLTPWRVSPASAAPFTTKTVKVTNISQLKTLASGTSYVVASGTYESTSGVKISGVKDVVITAENPNNLPVFKYTGPNTTSTSMMTVTGEAERVRIEHLRYDTKAKVNSCVVISSALNVTVHDIAVINPGTGTGDIEPQYSYVVRTTSNARNWTISGCKMPFVSRYFAYTEGRTGDITGNVIGDSKRSHVWRNYASDVNVWGNDLTNPAYSTSVEVRRAVVNLKERDKVAIWKNKLAGAINFGPLGDGDGDVNDTTAYLHDVRCWHNEIDLVKNETISMEAGAKGIVIEANLIRTYIDRGVIRVDAIEPYLSVRGLPEGTIRNNIITGPQGAKLINGDGSKIKQEGNTFRVAA